MLNPNRENGTRRRRTREERNKLIIRIIALLMALLMVAGAAYYTLYLLTMAVSAADVNENAAVIDTSSLSAGGDVAVRVGLMYGSAVTVGFETGATHGFLVGSTDDTSSVVYSFTPLWELEETKITTTVDGNLSKRNMTYSLSYTAAETQVGAHHVQIDCSGYSREATVELLKTVAQGLSSYGLYPFPGYVDGRYVIRFGAFFSADEAYNWLWAAQSLAPELTCSVVGATSTAVSLVDPNTDIIRFEYDDGGRTELGLKAREDHNGNTYLETPAANIYDGVFVFPRSGSGVAVTNILSLEAYIGGVLPYEVSNTWPLETLKAFAVTVRSFTLTHFGRHANDGFDLCNNVHCQMYKGAGRINENVFRALNESAAQVITYNNAIVHAYYSSSTGGCTVSAADAWGGNVAYLVGKDTLWEKYMEHDNAFWVVEMTPSQLADRLRQAGHNVQGNVTNVQILELAKDSSYIKKLQVTDSYGTNFVISGSDNIRTALTPSIKSANFVVGRGSVEYVEHVVSYPKADEFYETPESGDETPSSGYDKDYGYTSLYGYHVLTADGVKVSDIDYSVTLLTGEGETDYERTDVFVLTSIGSEAFTGEVYVPKVEETEESVYETETLPQSTAETLYKVAYASNSDNFIFVGKGWGHGVGMSQYGAFDLANLGYNATQILNKYFDNIAIVPYRTVAPYNG